MRCIWTVWAASVRLALIVISRDTCAWFVCARAAVLRRLPTAAAAAVREEWLLFVAEPHSGVGADGAVGVIRVAAAAASVIRVAARVNACAEDVCSLDCFRCACRAGHQGLIKVSMHDLEGRGGGGGGGKGGGQLGMLHQPQQGC